MNTATTKQPTEIPAIELVQALSCVREADYGEIAVYGGRIDLFGGTQGPDTCWFTQLWVPEELEDGIPHPISQKNILLILQENEIHGFEFPEELFPGESEWRKAWSSDETLDALKQQRQEEWTKIWSWWEAKIGKTLVQQELVSGGRFAGRDEGEHSQYWAAIPGTELHVTEEVAVKEAVKQFLYRRDAEIAILLGDLLPENPFAQQQADIARRPKHYGVHNYNYRYSKLHPCDLAD